MKAALLHNARFLAVLSQTLFGVGKPSLLLRKIELMRKALQKPA
jgi:hypothetical protein